MLIPPFYQILIGLMHIGICIIDVIFNDIDLLSLRVDKILHILLNFQSSHHLALYLFDLLLFDLYHSFIMKCLLIYLMHSNLYFSSHLTILILMLII